MFIDINIKLLMPFVLFSSYISEEHKQHNTVAHNCHLKRKLFTPKELTTGKKDLRVSFFIYHTYMVIMEITHGNIIAFYIGILSTREFQRDVPFERL